VLDALRDRADDEAERDGREHGEDGDRPVLTAQEGHRALEDHAANLLHGSRSGVTAEDIAREPDGIKHRSRTRHGYQPCQFQLSLLLNLARVGWQARLLRTTKVGIQTAYGILCTNMATEKVSCPLHPAWVRFPSTPRLSPSLRARGGTHGFASHCPGGEHRRPRFCHVRRTYHPGGGGRRRHDA